MAVEVFETAGHRVIGASTSNVATRNVEDEAGVPSLNTTRLLMDLDAGHSLAPGTVLASGHAECSEACR